MARLIVHVVRSLLLDQDVTTTTVFPQRLLRVTAFDIGLNYRGQNDF